MEQTITIATRGELLFLLSEASALEHALACAYLFAAFSLKSDTAEGLTDDQLAAVSGWRGVIEGIAAQEMLHLALASNLLTALGAAPHFRRPNFPQTSTYFPVAFRIPLTPFGEETLKRFIHVERPEGMELEDEDLAELQAAHPRAALANEIGPDPQDYATIGHLYRAIEDGFRNLVEKYGEERVFVGPPLAQATTKYFSFDDLIPVTDLASVIAAIEVITEQGEGFRGNWKNAHYGKFLRVHDEYLALRAADAGFEPARPVLENPFARVPHDAPSVNVIDDPYTVEVSDLFNAAYELLLQMLTRFFAHTEETEAELRTLINAAIDAMFSLIKPLGEVLTALPAGPSFPERTGGPSFEFNPTVHLLPHKHAAWVLFHERLLELGAYCGRLVAHAGAPPGLREVQGGFEKLAAALEEHLSPAEAAGKGSQ